MSVCVYVSEFVCLSECVCSSECVCLYVCTSLSLSLSDLAVNLALTQAMCSVFKDRFDRVNAGVVVRIHHCAFKILHAYQREGVCKSI